MLRLLQIHAYGVVGLSRHSTVFRKRKKASETTANLASLAYVVIFPHTAARVRIVAGIAGWLAAAVIVRKREQRVVTARGGDCFV